MTENNPHTENSARALLGENVTLAVINGGRTETFGGRGIKTLLNILESDPTLLCGASIADKIVGKAAAMMFAKGGVKSVYAEVLSKSAVEVLNKHKIKFTYRTLTDFIVNRTGNGHCPMENAVQDINEPDEAYIALCRTVEELSKQ